MVQSGVLNAVDLFHLIVGIILDSSVFQELCVVHILRHVSIERSEDSVLLVGFKSIQEVVQLFVWATTILLLILRSTLHDRLIIPKDMLGATLPQISIVIVNLVDLHIWMLNQTLVNGRDKLRKLVLTHLGLILLQSLKSFVFFVLLQF